MRVIVAKERKGGLKGNMEVPNVPATADLPLWKGAGSWGALSRNQF